MHCNRCFVCILKSDYFGLGNAENHCIAGMHEVPQLKEMKNHFDFQKKKKECRMQLAFSIRVIFLSLSFVRTFLRRRWADNKWAFDYMSNKVCSVRNRHKPYADAEIYYRIARLLGCLISNYILCFVRFFFHHVCIAIFCLVQLTALLVYRFAQFAHRAIAIAFDQ